MAQLDDEAFEAAISANSTADAQGVINHVNQAFLDLWGYATKEEAVGNSVLAPQLVCYRVHVADIHLVDGYPGVVGRHAHGLARIAIGAVLHRPAQVGENEPDGALGVLPRRAPLPAGDIGFDGVGERVHPGRRGDRRGHTALQLGIEGHGGRITAENADGGVRFSVVLPVADAKLVQVGRE